MTGSRGGRADPVVRRTDPSRFAAGHGRRLGLGLGLVAVLSLTACQTTQQQSAELQRRSEAERRQETRDRRHPAAPPTSTTRSAARDAQPQGDPR